MAVWNVSVVFSCYSLKYVILNPQIGSVLKSCISWMFLVCVLGTAGRGGRHLDCFIQQLCEEQSLCPPGHRSAAVVLSTQAVQVLLLVGVQLSGYSLNCQLCEYTSEAISLTGANCWRFTYCFRNQRDEVGCWWPYSDLAGCEWSRFTLFFLTVKWVNNVTSLLYETKATKIHKIQVYGNDLFD